MRGHSTLLILTLLVTGVARANGPAEATVVHSYDIRDLISEVPDWTDAPDLNATSSAQAQQQGAGGLFGSNQPQPGHTRQEIVEELSKLITTTIKPETWQENGGKIGSMKEWQGRLVINQAPDVHEQIQRLLDEHRKQLARPIRFRAHWIQLQRRDLEKLLKPADAASGPAAVLTVDGGGLEKLPDSVPHSRAEVVCLDGQRVHLFSTLTITSPGDPPTVMVTGIVLDVMGIVAENSNFAQVTLRSQVADVDHAGDRGVKLAAPTQASTRPASESPSISFLQKLATSARLPLGKTVLIGGMTPGPTAAATDPTQLYLLLEVSAD